MSHSRIYKPAAVLLAEAAEAAKTMKEPAEEQLQSKPFPLHCLPPTITEMARAICKTERTPESLAGCCVLGVLSASIGSGIQVKSGPNRVTRGNLFIMASGESASGKSETYRHAVMPFREFEKEMVEHWQREKKFALLAEKELIESEIASMKKSKCSGPVEREETRATIESKRKALAEIEGQLDAPILTVEDITSEALAICLAKHNECLTSLSSDAGEIINNLLGRYNKLDRTDDGIYVKIWSGDEFKQNRVGRTPVMLSRPCLSALWLVQRDKVETILSERTLTEGGAIPRLLICHTNCQPRYIDENVAGIPENVAEAYRALIRHLIQTFRLATEPVTIEPTPEALRALNGHYNRIVDRWRNGEVRDVCSYALRWTEQAWRIAVCLHAGIHVEKATELPLSLETAQMAIEIADWFSEQQLGILASGRMERRLERARRLQCHLDEHQGNATLRNLEKSHGYGAAEVECLAADFPQLFQIETKQNPNGGPQSRILRLSNC